MSQYPLNYKVVSEIEKGELSTTLPRKRRGIKDY